MHKDRLGGVHIERSVKSQAVIKFSFAKFAFASLLLAVLVSNATLANRSLDEVQRIPGSVTRSGAGKFERALRYRL